MDPAPAPPPAPPPPDGTPGGGAGLLRSGGLVLALLLVALAGMILVARIRGRSAPDAPPPVVEMVPDFSFEERGGRTVARADLLGKVWVFDSFFSRCGGPCPVMSERMAEIHGSLRPEDRALCVSLTVNPTFDTAKVMRGYADRHGASADRWLFLRGTWEATRKFLVEGLHLPAGDEEREQSHSVRFLLVDRRGRVRGYYVASGSDAVRDMERLHRDLRAVLAEPGP